MSQASTLQTEAEAPTGQFARWRPVLARAREVADYAGALFDGYDQAMSDATDRRTVSVGGETFEIATDAPEYLAMALTALADQPEKSTPSGKILIAGTGRLPSLPPAPIWEDHRFNDHRMCQKFEPTDLRLHHYRERDFWQFYDRSTGRGAQVMASLYAFPDWDPGSPLRNLLRWHLTHARQGFVHAGSLGVDGFGVMLAGPGGSGKSGTVLGGLIHGLDSVGDDYILARTPEGGGVTVAPIFNTLKNDPKGMERLGLKDGNNPNFENLGTVNWQGKHQFTFKDLIGRGPVSDMTVGALCVPMVTGAERSEITPMPSREAFLALAQTGFQQMPGDSRHGLTFCTELIKRLPTYRLALGTEPEEIVDCLRRFIDDLRAGRKKSAS